ncbi:hypothetical protein SSPO_015950 [Streptomyces antimycoticus]|uniref:Uncharacterized protein n=1 Tax=Streptomyces antimycoticus TaxID=68175 RepID=A0A499UY76_9ACTN|nr:hypothetical protein [Streptomyces antimycoticus]BBJ38877.1 hypothetical protein SSPO_015950 [Streptomyces antimycoticus]
MLPITVFTGLVSAPSRGMSGLRLRLADIADVLRDTGDRRTSRRVWARAGRAHVEVHGLTGHGTGMSGWPARWRTRCGGWRASTGPG